MSKIKYYTILSLFFIIACEPQDSNKLNAREQNTPIFESDDELNSDISQDMNAPRAGYNMSETDAQNSSGVEQTEMDMDIISANDATTDLDEDMMIGEPQGNLLLNPGFEDGAAAWGIWGGASRVESEAYEGQWALKATNGNGAEQQVRGLRPGATYRLSGWGRSLSDEPMLIGIKEYGGEQITVTFTDTEYTNDSLSFTMGATNSEAVVFTYKHRDEQPGYADALDLSLESEPSPPADPLADLELVWSDEFTGSGPLDSEKWGFEEGFKRNEEVQWYQPENAFREDGFLVIEGRREDRPNPSYSEGSTDWRTQRENIEYSSASVITKDHFDWKYGRLEVRAKVTNYTGTWPAIWTLGVECEWPSNGEVDVMENYGGDILANFAWGTNRRWNAQWDSSHHPVSARDEAWVNEFHLWVLDWTEDRMTISLDDEVLNSIDLNTVSNGSSNCAGQNPFRQNHYLLLNLALGGAGGSVSQLAFPTRYLVDYVRIYQVHSDSK
ncbi:MAG: hypothetical protein CMH49_02070 [Myxococcales bacterium]|nr:hypothetical protein [Myxococcales bacterium]